MKNGLRLLIICLLLSTETKAYTQQDLLHLQMAYPHQIKTFSGPFLIWQDGSRMAIGKAHQSQPEKLSSPTLADQLDDMHYVPGKPADTRTYQPRNDAGRVRYEPFFK